MRNHWTQKRIEQIKRLYKEGLSTAKIAALFEVNAETIRTLLHRHGATVRSREQASTKYKLDKHFFDEIDTEEKSYWLGFLTADGGIVNHQLILSLKMDDKPHIESFCQSIQSDHPIKISTTTIRGKTIQQPRLVISSMPLTNSLKKLGVSERKSLVVKPAKIRRGLAAAYWRGVFDGDGHIYVSPTARVAELTGNEFMLDGFRQFLMERTGIESTIEKGKSVYRVRHSRRSSVFSIAKLLYSESGIHLTRKYRVAQTIFEDKTFCLRKNSRFRQHSLV